MKDMEGRVAVVTGGAVGIGFATAREFARRGAKIAICDIDGIQATRSASKLNAAGAIAVGFSLDVADRAACLITCQKIHAELGPVAILVNNAGIAGMANLGDDKSAELWDRSVAINLTGVYNMTVACLAGLKETRGTVVNISSVVAFSSGFAQVGYGASKGGVRSLTQSMCRELTQFGIRVNAVAPGYVETPMTAPNKEKFQSWLDMHCPMKRYGQPEELAKAIAFLASDDASYVNGVTLPVDGGYLVV